MTEQNIKLYYIIINKTLCTFQCFFNNFHYSIYLLYSNNTETLREIQVNLLMHNVLSSSAYFAICVIQRIFEGVIAQSIRLSRVNSNIFKPYLYSNTSKVLDKSSAPYNYKHRVCYNHKANNDHINLHIWSLSSQVFIGL